MGEWEETEAEKWAGAVSLEEEESCKGFKWGG